MRQIAPLILGVLVAGCIETPTEPLESPPPSSMQVLRAPLEHAASDYAWSPTGNLSVPRRDHAAVLLDDGTVLIVGGTGGGPAELYDPMPGIFTSLGPTVFPRTQGATATKLLDGTVLIVGGTSDPTRAEIYDPSTRVFSAVTATTNANRTAHTATLLADGRVLLAGGQNFGPLTHAEAEVYDPGTAAFAPVGDLNDDRDGHGAVRLADGRVLIMGGTQSTAPGIGINLSSAELFDPATGSFSRTGDMGFARCCLSWTGTPLLASGKVFVAGGFGLTQVEIFDAVSQTFVGTGDLASPHGSGSTTLLTDGQVLVAGGNVDVGPIVTATAELYNPVSGTFAQTASMSSARQQHTATRLTDGRVLVVGGYSGSSDLASAEVFGRSYVEVEIDIMPGSESNSINAAAEKQVVTVALLTTTDFDATTVDHTKVRFEGASETHIDRRIGEIRRHEQDLDDDGDLDLVLHVRVGETRLDASSTAGTVTGETYDGMLIRGTDAVNVLVIG